ncbi:piggyBac transposable element-derived protein 4-like [Agrilus planipennis]|uniref:PiggyBac transposable element-derived protein 4-like n=1 Tax=Agrilus planipennis TaxID=224129 RepID=A0A7F5R5R0_AGRPL|nr:piggyBac transposable element-derived protein 4-like [Agrilus planipennis]
MEPSGETIVTDIPIIQQSMKCYGHSEEGVYIPSKPNKYGLKVYALVDAKMFYTAKMEIYVGQQPVGPFYVNTSNMFLVPRLCQPISGSNRNLTTDNFFSSIPLAYTLLQEHKLTLIGTLKKNKPQIPPDMMIKRPEKTTMFAFEEKSTLVSYIPKPRKNVFLLSTMHLDDSIDGETGKPSIIIDYNKTKGGVDTVDKLCAAYNCARITRRWPLVLFYGLLNIAGINSYIIYKNNNIDKNIPSSGPKHKLDQEVNLMMLWHNVTDDELDVESIFQRPTPSVSEPQRCMEVEEFKGLDPEPGCTRYMSRDPLTSKATSSI